MESLFGPISALLGNGYLAIVFTAAVGFSRARLLDLAAIQATPSCEPTIDSPAPLRDTKPD